MRRSSIYFRRYLVLLFAALLLAGACSDSDGDNSTPDPGDVTSPDAGGESDAGTSDTSDDEDATGDDAADPDGAGEDATGDDATEGDATESDTQEPPDGEAVALKIIAFNDLHGHLEAPAGRVNTPGGSVDAGGVAYMKTRADELRAGAEHSVLVAAGDMVGASPLLSAMYRDEPTIEALNLLGLEVTAVGNHEFDGGWEELLRLQNGGCHESGCDWIEPFEGAEFPFLAANVLTESGDTLLPSTLVKEYDGVKVGFIGLTLEETGQITRPSATEGLTFEDEVETIDREVAKLQDDGIETIIVLIHEGGVPTGSQPTVSDCGDMQGPIVDIARNTNEAVDVFISGHTHQAYICDIDGRLVTSGFSFGRVLTEVDLVIDRASGDVTQKVAENHVVENEGATPDPIIDDFLTELADYAADADPVVAQITQTISRSNNSHGESPMGDLVADSHLAATSAPGEGGAQIAMANSGGIRDNLSSSGASAQNPGDITFSQVFDVLPFGNTLVTVTLTGAQVHELLEQQFTDSEYSIMQVSEGFSYSYTLNAPVGSHVDPASIKLNGQTIDPNADYRITVNSYMAEGGDYLEVLTEGTDRLEGPQEVDKFAQYLREISPVSAPTPNRITRLDP